MNARTILVVLLGLVLVALPVAAQTNTDGWYLDSPELNGNLEAGGGNGGDASGPWPGDGRMIWIVPPAGRTKALSAAALPLSRGVLLAWPAWDGHDTEIVVAVLDGSAITRSVPVTRDEGRDEEPMFLARRETVQLAWVHREGGRASLRAVRLAPDGRALGEARVVGPAGRKRLVTVLPGGRVAALVLRGSTGHSRLELVTEGGRRVPVARLGRRNELLDVVPGPGGTQVFRFRDGALTGSLVVDAEGRVRDLDWGEE